jgi:hypothetical protein
VFSAHPKCRQPSPNCTKVLEYTNIHDLDSMTVLVSPLELAFGRAVVLNIRDRRTFRIPNVMALTYIDMSRHSSQTPVDAIQTPRHLARSDKQMVMCY